MRKLRTPSQVVLAKIPAFLTRLADNNQGIAPVPFTRGKVVVVSKPQYVETVLLYKNAATYGKGSRAEKYVAQALGSRGLFLVEDTVKWASLRKLMNPAFRRTAMPLVAQYTTAALEMRMQTWQTNQPIDLFEEFKRLNIEVLIRHLFGTGASDTDIAELSRLADPVFEGMAWQVFMPKWLPGGLGYRRAIRRLEKKIDALVLERKQHYLGDPAQPASDLLGRLVRSTKPWLSRVELRDQVMTLLMAGFDSTATVLCAAARALAFNINGLQLDALRNELHEVTGGSPVSYEHLPHLPLLDKFIDKILHKHPAFPDYFREVKQECVLGGLTLASGTQLVIGLHAMHNMQESDRDSNDKLTSIPFGYGPRKCIGESMARVTMKLVLGRMLQRYSTWKLADPYDHRKVYAMTERYFNNNMYLSA